MSVGDCFQKDGRTEMLLSRQDRGLCRVCRQGKKPVQKEVAREQRE